MGGRGAAPLFPNLFSSAVSRGGRGVFNDDAEGEQTIRSGKYNIVADDIRVAFFNGRSLRKPRVVRRGASIKIHFRPNGAIVPKLIFLGCKPKPVFILLPMLAPSVPIIITRKTEFFLFRPWPMPQGRKRINIGFKFCMCWSGRDMDKAGNG